MNEELKKEIIDILDNVSYWETCPEDYKARIESIKQQLIIGGVSVECEHPYAYVHTRCMGEINHCLKCGKDL
jgi:hypothetical protein